MTDDPTIARIRAVRHKISEQYHHDVYQLILHYIELEHQHEGRFLDLTAEALTTKAAHDRPFDKRHTIPIRSPLEQGTPLR